MRFEDIEVGHLIELVLGTNSFMLLKTGISHYRQIEQSLSETKFKPYSVPTMDYRYSEVSGLFIDHGEACDEVRQMVQWGIV